MKKAVLVFLACALLGFGCSTRTTSETTVVNQKNVSPKIASSFSPIIIIDICSLRKDHMSGFGYFRSTTPNLDAFMDESAVFDNYWTQAGACLPNFGTLLTGTRPEIHQLLLGGVGKRPLSPEIETVPEILNKLGYKTAGFSGSRFLMTKDSGNSYGLDRGFDYFENFYVLPTTTNNGAEMSFAENLPGIKKWLAKNKDNPFFLYATVDDLHSPYTADDPKLYFPTYKGILDTVEPTMEFDRAYNGEFQNQQDPVEQQMNKAVQEFRKDPNNMKFLKAKYDASVHRTDRLVGELFAALKKEGLWDKSTIFITFHQGEQLGEHGLLGHTQDFYEQILSGPLMVKLPGQTQPVRLAQLAERIDIPATVLDLAGVLGGHKQFSGKSFLPLLQNPAVVWEKPYIFASNKTIRLADFNKKTIDERAVRNNRYKLIWYEYKKVPYELYDLQNDPGETKNLVTTEPGIFAELKAALDEYVTVNKMP